MAKEAKKEWNNEHHYYEMVNGEERTRVDRVVEKTLTEEVFSATLLSLRKPNYNRIKLMDEARIQEQIALGTKGSGERKGEDSFGTFEDPIVFYKEITVDKKKLNVPHLRTISSSRPNDLYLTLIHKKLWKYERQSVIDMIKKFHVEMKKAKIWKSHGWEDCIPPSKMTGKRQYDLQGFINLCLSENKTKAE